MRLDRELERHDSGRRGSRQALLLGLAVALAYLLPALVLLPAYGPTWDCVMGEFPFGERLLGYLETRDERFLDLRSREPRPELRAPHPDFDFRRFGTHQVYPLGALVSALSCRWLWTEAGVVPAMVAHDLAVVLFAALLVGAVTWFGARRFGAFAGVLAGLFLVLAPRFFADSFNNLKDVPEACLYTLAAFGGLEALERGGYRRWGLAGILVGLALAQKVNAVFVPVQLLLVWMLSRVGRRAPEELTLRISARGVAAGAAGFLVAWYAASPHFWTAPIAAPSAYLAQVFRGALANDGGVSFEAPLQMLITTPVLVLLLGVIGACRPGSRAGERAFLLLGVAVPVGRNLLPGMRNYDGVRHFLEFLPMLCLLAATGLDLLAGWLRGSRSLRWVLPGLVLLPGTVGVVRTHPNGITYYNSLVGGLAGAQALGIRGARDYWANSYWQGLAWLNANAESGARLIVPVGEQVARAAAPVRLREDLGFWTPERSPERDVIYVMAIAHSPEPFLRALRQESPPAHEIRVQGGTILEIFRLGPGAGAPAAWPPSWDMWRRKRMGAPEARRLLAYLRGEPERFSAVRSILARRKELGREEILAQIRPLVPAELGANLDLALWTLLGGAL